MADELIISISGMRGVVGENLSATEAEKFGCAFGTYLKTCGAEMPQPVVCIGRDSRISGRMLASAVAAGLCSVGIDVVDATVMGNVLGSFAN